MEIGRKLEKVTFGPRMGIHSAPVNKVADVNDPSNVAGTGINLAEPVIGLWRRRAHSVDQEGWVRI
jgi:hypothetical protein